MRAVLLLVALVGAVEGGSLEKFTTKSKYGSLSDALGMLKEQIQHEMKHLDKTWKDAAQNYLEFACVCREAQEKMSKRMQAKGSEISKANANIVAAKTAYNEFKDKKEAATTKMNTHLADEETEEKRGNKLIEHLNDRIAKLNGAEEQFKKAVRVLQNTDHDSFIQMNKLEAAYQIAMWKQPEQAYKSSTGAIIEMVKKMQEDIASEKLSIQEELIRETRNHEKEVMGLRQNANQEERKKIANTKAMAGETRVMTNEAVDLNADTQVLMTTQSSLINKVKECRKGKKIFDDRIDALAEEMKTQKTLYTIIVDYAMVQQGEVNKEAADDFLQTSSKKTFGRKNLPWNPRWSILQESEKPDVSGKLQRLIGSYDGVSMIMEAAAKGDPFGKIRGLIRDKIEAMEKKNLKEQGHHQKCQRLLGVNKQKLMDAYTEQQEAMNALQDETNRFNAANKAKYEIEVDHDELMQQFVESERIRIRNWEENHEMLTDAKQGLDAIRKAAKILGGMDKGAHSKAGGDTSGMEDIQSMLEVVEDQFAKEIEKIETAEKSEEDEFKQLFQDNREAVAKMKVQHKQAISKRSTAKSEAGKQKDLLEAAQKSLNGFAEQWDQLKETTCKDKGVSYEQRVAAREAEISALKNALGVLEDAATL